MFNWLFKKSWQRAYDEHLKAQSRRISQVENAMDKQLALIEAKLTQLVELQGVRLRADINIDLENLRTMVNNFQANYPSVLRDDKGIQEAYERQVNKVSDHIPGGPF